MSASQHPRDRVRCQRFFSLATSNVVKKGLEGGHLKLDSMCTANAPRHLIAALAGSAALLLCGNAFVATPAGHASVPSAIHQYTEEPPGDAGGPLQQGDAISMSGANSGGDGASPTSSSEGQAGTASDPDAPTQGNEGGAQGNGGAQAGKGGNGPNNPSTSPQSAAENTELAADTSYPLPNLLWLAVVLLALALIARIVIVARSRASHRTAE
jgi:hypothetical protein